MVLIYLKNSECIEVKAAVRAESDAQEVRCLDRSGKVVATFNARDVTMFTSDPATAEVISEELCEDEAGTLTATKGV